MVRYEPVGPNSGALPIGTTPETELQPDGSLRQVVKIGENSLPAGASTSANQTNGSQLTKILGTDGSGLDVFTRTQTPTSKVIGVQIGPGDIISNIPVVMDFAQHQIHEGESHGVGYYTTSVATISFGLTVPVFNPTISAPHLIFHAQIYEGAGELSLFEGSTFTGGTLMTAYNRNRNNATAPAMTIKSGVTVTAAGTRLPYTQFVGASQKTSGESRTLDEIVLKSNTIYTVVFEEIVAIARLALHFEWYEDLGV